MSRGLEWLEEDNFEKFEKIYHKPKIDDVKGEAEKKKKLNRQRRNKLERYKEKHKGE